jgi:hypothetical protein
VPPTGTAARNSAGTTKPSIEQAREYRGAHGEELPAVEPLHLEHRVGVAGRARRAPPARRAEAGIPVPRGLRSRRRRADRCAATS